MCSRWDSNGIQMEFLVRIPELLHMTSCCEMLNWVRSIPVFVESFHWSWNQILGIFEAVFNSSDLSSSSWNLCPYWVVWRWFEPGMALTVCQGKLLEFAAVGPPLACLPRLYLLSIQARNNRIGMAVSTSAFLVYRFPRMFLRFRVLLRVVLGLYWFAPLDCLHLKR